LTIIRFIDLSLWREPLGGVTGGDEFEVFFHHFLPTFATFFGRCQSKAAAEALLEAKRRAFTKVISLFEKSVRILGPKNHPKTPRNRGRCTLYARQFFVKKGSYLTSRAFF